MTVLLQNTSQAPAGHNLNRTSEGCGTCLQQVHANQ